MSRTLTVYLAANLKNFSQGLRKGQGDLGTFGNATRKLGETLSASLGPALMAAGAAAAYAAVQFGVDGVKAAIEDEAAVAKLAQTMTNLGLAHDTAQVEASIAAMETELGIVDMELRPAYDRLVRSIGDTQEAMKAMSLAADISAGTGKSLDAVVQALGRAYDGNAEGLSRLGAGLSSTLLKSGDMKAITEQLARTFGGQATTKAQTYEGQIKRLSLEFDNLKESFGRGFLTGLGDANDKTDELMATMKELEPELKKIGVAASKAAVGLAKFAAESANVVDGAIAMVEEPGWDKLISHLKNTFEATDQFKGAIGSIPGVGGFLEDLYDIVAGFIALNDAQGNGFVAIGGGEFPNVDNVARGATSAGAATARYTGLAKSLGETISTTGGNLDTYFTSVSRAGGGSSAAAKETDTLTTAFDLQRDVVEKLQETLDSQVTDLERATQAVKDYSSTLASQLLGGIDLGAAQQTGAELGTSTLEAFDQQIAQAQWFGNVLSSIKASGADQRLIDQLAALGPAAGGKLAQEMIDKGLVQTFSDRLVDVIATATTVSQAMVPEFLTAGVDSATDFVDGTIEQLLLEQNRLKKIGKTMGKAIGVNIKAEIAQAVAEAVAAAQAAKTAAAAERASEIAAQQVVVSEQQIAQALQRLITNSNSRAGYSMGVPVQTPVLG